MKHPAKFTEQLLPELRRYLPAGCSVLDPFAGTGLGVRYLRGCGHPTVGVELEPEWARMTLGVLVGNATELPFATDSFDAVVTSPCYGNRLADRDRRPSVAGTYMKALGREASTGSACHLQWGDAYRSMHEATWAECRRVIRPGGHLVLNCKDHVRGGHVVPVTAWHVETLERLGFKFVVDVEVPCPGLRFGANARARVDVEHVVTMTLCH